MSNETRRLEAALRFRKTIDYLGGQVTGEYINAHVPVCCVCPKGHKCSPVPNSVILGQGMCVICAHNKTTTSMRSEARERFVAEISKRGGRVIGDYVNRSTPVQCICPEGHECKPWPLSIFNGQGMCAVCSSMSQDVFYIVRNNYTGNIKVGITTGNSGKRLSVHHRDGYTTLLFLADNLSPGTARQIETDIMIALYRAGFRNVRGYEYFDAAAAETAVQLAKDMLHDRQIAA